MDIAAMTKEELISAIEDDKFFKEARQLKQRNSELMVQIEWLKGVLQSMGDSHLEDGETECAEMFFVHVRATPNQCLAEHNREVAARAVEGFCKWLLISIPDFGLIGLSALMEIYMPEYLSWINKTHKG